MKKIRILLPALSMLSLILRIAGHSEVDGTAVAKSDREQVQEQAKREFEESLKSTSLVRQSGDPLKSKSSAAPDRTAVPAESQ